MVVKDMGIHSRQSGTRAQTGATRTFFELVVLGFRYPARFTPISRASGSR